MNHLFLWVFMTQPSLNGSLFIFPYFSSERFREDWLVTFLNPETQDIRFLTDRWWRRCLWRHLPSLQATMWLSVSTGFNWFQLVSTGFNWFQLVSTGFNWFQLVSTPQEVLQSTGIIIHHPIWNSNTHTHNQNSWKPTYVILYHGMSDFLTPWSQQALTQPPGLMKDLWEGNHLLNGS